MKTLSILGAALAMAVSATASMAASGSYTGTWPLTITKAQYLNGTYCLTVTDEGGGGWKHSGTATIPEYTYGEFQVINGKFIADIVVPAQGQNEVLVFTANGHNGIIGDGAVQQISGGEPLYQGVMTVGAKNSC
jgi:hypothetical protein